MTIAPTLAVSGSNAALWTFLVYTVAIFVIAGFANRLLKKKNFLGEYFLGSRGLGVWAFALTFAATSASGGSFTGFPAKIYTHGWILALWISSYMIVPICTMGLLGKRINQVARKTGAITIPDVLRDRFSSPLFGLLCTLLIVFFLSFNLVAQFKAGSVILQTLVSDVTLFQSTSSHIESWISGIRFFDGVQSGYLTCLILFGVAVVVYTTYGGFHAVVWTDVMQGIVMVAGVAIMLPLAITQAGGLTAGTHKLAETYPETVPGQVTLQLPQGTTKLSIRENTFLALPQAARETLDLPYRTIQVRGPVTLSSSQPSERVDVILSKQSRETLTKEAGQNSVVTADVPEMSNWAVGPTSYVTGPGPSGASMDGFLPLGMAISFFFMWAISGTGQPQNMVRLMAFKNSQTLRRAIITVTCYYGAIYFPLVIIFCLARVLLPGMENEPDRIMPAMAVTLTENIGHGWLAGLLIAAPFAAVMSTVDSFLLVISSAIVRDVYQRNINPDASEKTIKRLSYLTTLTIGTVAMVYAINPPKFLQDIIVYVGSGLAACFLFPIAAMLYFPRSNVYGCAAGLLGGFFAHLTPHAIAKFQGGSFAEPISILGCSPVIIGLFASLVCTAIVTPLTPPPPEALVRRYFYKNGA